MKPKFFLKSSFLNEPPNIILCGLFFLLVFFVMNPPLVLPEKIAIVLRCMFLLFLAVIVVIRLIYRKLSGESFVLIVLSGLFIFVNLISTIIDNGSIIIYGCAYSIFSSSLLFIAIAVPVVSCNENRDMLRTFEWIAGIYVLIDAFLAIVLESGFNINADGQYTYFSGGKFGASYMYLLWMLLFLLNRPNARRLVKAALTAFGMLLCYKADCNTGLLMVVVFGILSIIEYSFFTKRNIIILYALIVISCVLIIFFKIQTKIPALSKFIVNVLHRSLDLTNRYRSYSKISELMSGHWLLGWGMTSERITAITGMTNTQNGLLQIMYNGGIVALSIWLVIIALLINKLVQIDDMKIRSLLASALAAFFVACIVEIPFQSGKSNIVLMLILFYSLGQNRNLPRQCAENGIAIT